MTSQSRNADVYAPGSSLVSLSVPGSYIDVNFPGGRVGTRFFKGSGSSQATAVTAGAAALLLQRYPTATPWQIRRMLGGGCPSNLHGCAQGTSILDLKPLLTAPLPTDPEPSNRIGTGTGSLDTARGTSRLVHNGVTLIGEKDIFGKAWSSRTITAAAQAGTAWQGGSFNGSTWAGTTWTGNKFATATWPATWTGASWSQATATSNTWNGVRWTGGTWSGVRWTGVRWTGSHWSSAGWQ